MTLRGLKSFLIADVAAAWFRNQDRIPFRLNLGGVSRSVYTQTMRARTFSHLSAKRKKREARHCQQPPGLSLHLPDAIVMHAHTHTAHTHITPVTRSAFACGLGSTDSCPTTVHMKPFSTSVLEDLSRVFATTTKICTDGGSRQARAHNPSTLTVATPLLVGASAPSLSSS